MNRGSNQYQRVAGSSATRSRAGTRTSASAADGQVSEPVGSGQGPVFTAQPRFPLGRIVATPAALETLDKVGVTADDLLGRHQSGDWGTVDGEDAAENDYAVGRNLRVFSAYTTGDDKVWVITEADRSATTILCPSDY